MIESLTVAAAVGSGLIAGVFLVFSVTIMPALARQPVERAIAVMNAINEIIVKSLFLLVFLATVALSVAVVVLRPDALRISGALLYVLGTFGLTMVANVPMNNALAAADLSDTAAWQRYLARWTAWNHVRTSASTAAAVAFTVAVI